MNNMCNIINTYLYISKKFGFILFGWIGYCSCDLINKNCYESHKRYIFIKISNTFLLSLIGYYIGPMILPLLIYRNYY
jgi:hypothetical protein